MFRTRDSCELSCALVLVFEMGVLQMCLLVILHIHPLAQICQIIGETQRRITIITKALGGSSEGG